MKDMKEINNDKEEKVYECIKSTVRCWS